MNILQQFLTENDCYKAGRYIVRPTGIMVHSTGANNPRLSRYLPGDELIGYNQNGNHWNQPELDVAVHGFIGLDASGNVQIYQALPWNMRGWHAGGAANNTHISFEICEDGLDDAVYFSAVYAAAVDLCAFLAKEYGIDPSCIICHSEGAELGIASNHADVMHWFPRFGKTMDDFRQAVRQALTPPPAEEDSMIRYAYLKDIPNEYGFQDIVSTLMDAKIINGDGSDPDGNGDIIDLSHDQVRSLVFEYRGGAFDRKLMAMGMPPAVQV